MSKVIIDKCRYVELLQSELRLSILDTDGVDNWEWYLESASDQDRYLLRDQNEILEVLGEEYVEFDPELVSSTIVRIQTDIADYYENYVPSKDNIRLLNSISNEITKLRMDFDHE